MLVLGHFLQLPFRLVPTVIPIAVGPICIVCNAGELRVKYRAQATPALPELMCSYICMDNLSTSMAFAPVANNTQQ
jgi:hypothetical protein